MSRKKVKAQEENPLTMKKLNDTIEVLQLLSDATKIHIGKFCVKHNFKHAARLFGEDVEHMEGVLRILKKYDYKYLEAFNYHLKERGQ